MNIISKLLTPLAISTSALLLSCTSKNETPITAINSDISDRPVTYDGQVQIGDNKYLALTITLRVQSALEGSYEFTESLIDNDIIIESSEQRGFYTLQSQGEHTILSLENSTRSTPLRRSFIMSNGKIREQNFRHRDLVFLLKEDHLELIDDNMLVSESEQDYLYKQVSPEFTIEGNMTYRGDTSFFYETNTKIIWPLTKYGAYAQAAREHNALADKKNDTTYLKGTGYAITVTRGESKIDALVLKKIIQSSPR